VTDNVKALLGGAVRKRTRARGFAAWEPKEGSLVLLRQVQAVLDEYRAQQPLTLRQIYYRMIGAHGYPVSRRRTGWANSSTAPAAPG
jgi:hypothetical protein